MSLLNKAITSPLSLAQKKVTPQERSALVKKIKANLKSIASGDEVFFQEKNPINFIFTFLVLIEMGAIPICLPNDLTEFQLENIKMKHSRKFLIQGVLSGKCLNETLYPRSYACLTSGVTGSPKLCYLGVENALKNANSHCLSMNISPQSTIIQSLPLYHSFGLIVYLFSWLEIGFYLNLNLLFMGLKTLEKKEWKNATLYVSPSQLRFMIKEKKMGPPGIVNLSIGGGSIDNASLEKIKEKFVNTKIYTTYGLSEAGPRVTTGLWTTQKTGHIGQAIKDVKLSILDSDKIKKQGHGKLLIKSPFLKLNTKEDELKDGHYITRDLVEINTAGEVTFRSREDDLINIGGISIYPIDIETTARSHSKVIDAIVLKRKNKIYEEEPFLFIEPAIDKISIRDFLATRLTVSQMPKKIITLNKFPRISIDKIDRRALTVLMETV